MIAGFNSHEVPSQQLVAGEIHKAGGVVGKTVFSSKQKDLRAQKRPQWLSYMHIARGAQKTSGIIRT